MGSQEFFTGREDNSAEAKKELTQAERTILNERWSELHYKLQNENMSSEERKIIEVEKEELRKQIT